MKKLLTMLLLMIPMACEPVHALDSIVLTEENTVRLTDEVSDNSITKVILSLEASTATTPYLYINSPGGSVTAGMVLIQYLLTTNKKIICIANYAASMAHAILETCPKRLGTPTNYLLQHKAFMGGQGTSSELQGQIKVLDGLELYLNKLESKRIGMQLEEFQRRTYLPWITFGEESLTEKLIDGIVQVTCDPALYKKSTIRQVMSTAGPGVLTTSACPLLEPLFELDQH